MSTTFACPSCQSPIGYAASKCEGCGYKITADDIEARLAQHRASARLPAIVFLVCIAALFAGLVAYCSRPAAQGASDGTTSTRDLMKFTVAETAVKRALRDPDSAEFRDERLGSVKGAEVVCGGVNSNNGFGGKSGFQRFISNGGGATVLEEQMEHSEFEKVWSEAGC